MRNVSSVGFFLLGLFEFQRHLRKQRYTRVSFLHWSVAYNFASFMKSNMRTPSQEITAGSPKRHQETIPNQDPNEPHSTQLPADMVQVGVCSAEEIPGHQLLGGEPACDFIFCNCLIPFFGEVHNISKAEASSVLASNLFFHGGFLSLDDPCMRKWVFLPHRGMDNMESKISKIHMLLERALLLLQAP